jgi:hypothetical protein
MKGWFHGYTQETAGGITAAVIVAAAVVAWPTVTAHPLWSIGLGLGVLVIVLIIASRFRWRPQLSLDGRYFAWGQQATQIPDQGKRDAHVLTDAESESITAAIWDGALDVEPSFTLSAGVHDTVYESDERGTWKRELRHRPDPKQRLVVSSPRRSTPPKCPYCGRYLTFGAVNCKYCLKPLPPRSA